MTPSTWPRSASICSRLRMPNPAHTGTGRLGASAVQIFQDIGREPRRSCRSTPVRVTAYKKPLAGGGHPLQPLGARDGSYHLHERNALRSQRIL